MKHIEKIVIWMIVVLFVGIVIIATDFWLLWLPLEHSSEYPQKVAALFMALTAFVTLLVVHATFNATKQSNLREETRRKDEIRKDNRDRDERLLNEIIEWAISIISLRAKSSYKPYSAKKSREMSVTTKLELMGAFMDIHTKETYIRLLADKLGLKIFMLEVTRHLNNHIRLIDLIFDGKVKNSEVMAKHRRILNKSTESLITEATKIKAGDIR